MTAPGSAILFRSKPGAQESGDGFDYPKRAGGWVGMLKAISRGGWVGMLKAISRGGWVGMLKAISRGGWVGMLKAISRGGCVGMLKLNFWFSVLGF